MGINEATRKKDIKLQQYRNLKEISLLWLLFAHVMVPLVLRISKGGDLETLRRPRNINYKAVSCAAF